MIGMVRIYGASLWQRSIALALAVLWLIVGVLPELHRHDLHVAVEMQCHASDVAVEVHCHNSRLTAATHLKTGEQAHPEACGLCAKVSSFEGLERSWTSLAGGHVSERAQDVPYTEPPVSLGRHSESRAPPLVIYG